MDKREEVIKNALRRYDCTYEVRLGSGAFSQVFQVRNSADKQKYAVKVTKIYEAAKYSQREIELITQDTLSHVNIVKYYKFWPMDIDKDVFLCIQMELCGDNLEAFVYNNEMGGVEIIKTQGPPRFYQHIFTILNGLDAIHSIGWVHSNINVNNILIANPKPSEISEIIVKIAGFDLARKMPEFEKSVDRLSPEPMCHNVFPAPETYIENYDSKIDIYSAGLVLYFLCRYLKDRTQWPVEFHELKNGNRSVQDLYHQDDENLSYLFSCLLKNNPKERPTARQALGLMRPQDVPKRFLIQKSGERLWRRCFADKPTLFCLKEAIERCIGVDAKTQVLRQEKMIKEEKHLINITSDEDVKFMFMEAELYKGKILIIVSEEIKNIKLY